MRTTQRPAIFYAHKAGKEFRHFADDPRTTKMYGEGQMVYAVSVRPVRSGEKSQYWGWLDYKDHKLKFVYPSLVQVRMVFPYGVEDAERRSTGKLVNLVVEEIRKT